jgi:hypothetical protein
MIKFLEKYFRLKMKYQVEAERYEVLRNTSFATIVGDETEQLRGVALDRKIDEFRVKVLKQEIANLNKALNETSGYESAMTYIKQRTKAELKIIEIEEQWG